MPVNSRHARTILNKLLDLINPPKWQNVRKRPSAYAPFHRNAETGKSMNERSFIAQRRLPALDFFYARRTLSPRCRIPTVPCLAQDSRCKNFPTAFFYRKTMDRENLPRATLWQIVHQCIKFSCVRTSYLTGSRHKTALIIPSTGEICQKIARLRSAPPSTWRHSKLVRPALFLPGGAYVF